MSASSTSDTPLEATPFDAGDDWEGDSGGSGIRGHENPTVPAEALARETPVEEEVIPGVTVPAVETPAHDMPVEGEDDEHADGDKPKKRTWQERQAEEKRRVAEIKTEREAEERSLQSIKDERTRLERELAALRATPAETPADKPAEVPAIGDEPTWAAYDAESKSFDEFTKDHAKWVRDSVRAEAKAEREAAEKTTREERERAADEARNAELEAAFEKRMDAAREKYPDLPEVAKSLDFKSKFLSTVVFRHEQGAELYNHLARHPEEARVLADLDFTQPFLTAVRETDDPIGLLSYLAQNRGEFDRIARKDPASALVALGRIVASTRREDVSPNASSSPAARVTQAAPPLRHVAGRQSTGGSDALDDKHPDDWTADDLKRITEKTRATLRRR